MEPGVVSGPSRPKGETRRIALQAEPEKAASLIAHQKNSCTLWCKEFFYVMVRT